MSVISLLEFFRTGEIGSIALGMTRGAVTNALGTPEDWSRSNPEDSTHPYSQDESLIWVYGGIEFYWTGNNAMLHEISFKPHYLHWHQWQTLIDRWIFKSHKAPTLKQLKTALQKEAIAFQDTGLEIFVAQNDINGRHNYAVIPLQNAPTGYDTDDVFGTLVLKSGVQVRYGHDNDIIKVATGDAWAIKGSERFIQWHE